MNEIERSQEKITRGDLEKLAKIANAYRYGFFVRNPRQKRYYENRFICSALCQGAALHYVNENNGVKDFDIYVFYYEHPESIFYTRSPKIEDFGFSKFGRLPNEKAKYSGRQVHLFSRSLKVVPGIDPIKAIRAYLLNPKTDTASYLAEKAVVILEPVELLGVTAWPLGIA